MTKQNFACPHPGCNFVSDQESTEIHQREVHPEPSMGDGWTDEEIWGEKKPIKNAGGERLAAETPSSQRTNASRRGIEQVSCGTVEGHGRAGTEGVMAEHNPLTANFRDGGDVASSAAGLLKSAKTQGSGYQAPPAGEMLDALGDSVSRAFQRAEFMKQFNAELDEEISDALPEIERFRDQGCK